MHRILDHDVMALDPDRTARIGVENTGQDLHQRAFASPVFSRDHMNLASLQPKVDVTERFHARKSLGDVVHLEKGGHRNLAATERGGGSATESAPVREIYFV